MLEIKTDESNEAWMERFYKEYWELNERASSLSTMINQYTRGTLPYNPASTVELLSVQYYIMQSYLRVLEERARLEGIDISTDGKLAYVMRGEEE